MFPQFERRRHLDSRNTRRHGTMTTRALSQFAGRTSFALAILSAAAAGARPAEAPRLSVEPSTIDLRGRASAQRIVVTRATETDRRIDVTASAELRTSPPGLVSISPGGVVRARRDGSGTMRVRVGDDEAEIPLTVANAAVDPPLTFEGDVQPIFTRRGCNSGPCHGKQRGQNGFQLSLLGFDDDTDYAAISGGAFARRLVLPAPERSLLLMKPTGELPHGGGIRVEKNDEDYATLLRWLRAGMPRRAESAPLLERVVVESTRLVLAPGDTRQLLVSAINSDGTRRDVTHLATYLSSESPVVAVDEDGRIAAGRLPGEATIMARYRGRIAVCDVLIPLEGNVDSEIYAALPRYNFIDELVWEKLERLGITPSKPASDSTFLRRAYLDVIGRLPSADEARAFLSARHETAADARAHRTALIDRLLARPEYADHWANKWVDLLRPNPYRVGIKAVLNLDHFVRDAFRRNQPYDEFVRDVVTATGSTFRNGATTIFRDRRSPDEIATLVSQIFLGVRIECSKCHQHPFESLSQADFYGFAAFFSDIRRKGTGLSPPISGSEEFVFSGAGGKVIHPRTGAALSPKPLFASVSSAAEHEKPLGSKRARLAEWMVRDNDLFDRAIVNRVWAEVMGRGLVEPVDDLRSTNPPSNRALLTALAAEFRRDQYDLKKLLRRILSSYVYGLASAPGERNAHDTRQYSRHYRVRLRAETLLDAVSDITGVPEKFSAMPPGSRASAIWTHRTPSLFLDTFGRPDPNQDPPCERTSDTSVVQALHLMNAPNLHAKVTSDAALAATLAASDFPADKIVEELYLRTFSRYPDESEREIGRALFSRKDTTRRRSTEDLLWALLNTPEFVFKN